MSRVGQKPIEVPSGVEITIEGNTIKAKGSLGELALEFSDQLKVENTDGEIKIEPAGNNKKANALWGLYRALIANMVQGVSKGFEKSLIITGVGYRAEAKGNNLVLNLGYSHPVEMEVPEGLDVQVEKNKITIKGIDKQKVGQFAADIRAKRPPEPYKGKGVAYEGEQIRRKAGKRAIGAGGAGA
ncbi:MAG: 50S ribosomal protein L6 [Candidatus Spechtbacterales bacterium]|nr:50S ribosomal protein L6 [Candidatus Spechtbacterales bacterium]